MTHQGLKKLQRERTDLRDWLGHIRLNIQQAITDHKKAREIELILFEKETVKNRFHHVDPVSHYAGMLPSAWGHTAELRASEATYLRHGPRNWTTRLR
jgi:hypothetical protein